MGTPPPSVCSATEENGRCARHAGSLGRNAALGAAILLNVALVLAGSWVSGGIVEEKSSRVVEQLLPAVRPRLLHAGSRLSLRAALGTR